MSCFKCKWLENDINLTLEKIQTQQHSNLRNYLLPKVLTWIYHCFQCILAVVLLKFSQWPLWLFLKIACDMTEALFYSAIYTAKSKKVALVIGHWVFGHMEQCKSDLLKWPPNIIPFTYTGNIRKQAWNQLSQWRPLHSENLMTVVCSISSRSNAKLHWELQRPSWEKWSTAASC